MSTMSLFSRRAIRETPLPVRDNAPMDCEAEAWATSWPLFRTTQKKYDDFHRNDYDASGALSMTDDSSSDDGSHNRDDDGPVKSFFDRLDNADGPFSAQDEPRNAPAAVDTEMDFVLLDAGHHEASMARSSLLTSGKQRVLRSAQRLTEGTRKLKKE
jgi:hypothetical protein